MTNEIDRRTFLARGAAAGIGLGVLGDVSSLSRLTSANDQITVAVMGVNSRGGELARSFARAGNHVAYICDVDSRAVENTIGAVASIQEQRPRGVTDFRTALDDREVDALVVAAPDHWHAPAALLAMQAGKHVYLEKPCSHNPREGEILVEAQRHYGLVAQMGNQQRSSPESIEAVELIRGGLIGRPYYGRAWYANTRGPIGRGRVAPVPEWLDYELWQGPAPRTPYRDNVVHYNWHWFWRWGTGEICNNGTHEIDVCRWALGVDYPVRVTSAGGRYHFDDDWECPDTQMASFDFEGGKSITWEGRSCNGRPVEGRSRGVAIHGTQGTIVMDRSGFVAYDNDNNEVARSIRGETVDPLDTRGGGSLTDYHIANFMAAIRGEGDLTAPVHDGRTSQLLCHLGNIAHRTGRSLQCDPATGRIVNDREAMGLWERDYEPGWEPRV
ncbi:MAG: Gfo/Idh/MocA family oxidoreductase [Gemmatimonadetes bacterium]|nr:Gfo/Idh/MocA family oxidoreductase [Gemmatimonadota bacterium]